MRKTRWFNGIGDTTTACCHSNMTNPNNYALCSPGQQQATLCGAIVDPIYDPDDFDSSTSSNSSEIEELVIRDVQQTINPVVEPQITTDDNPIIVDADTPIVTDTPVLVTPVTDEVAVVESIEPVEVVDEISIPPVQEDTEDGLFSGDKKYLMFVIIGLVAYIVLKDKNN